MCGIMGLCNINNETVDVRQLYSCSASLRHRGPDDEGYLLADLRSHNVTPCRGPDSDKDLHLPDIRNFLDSSYSLAFAFRRLSILDLSISGNQPMASADGKYWIVYNGEIYNYVELREELSRLGYQFASTSDTEVLLNGYIQWGGKVLNRLEGMFAFAILDLHQKRLFLARDFFGIKPLYYSLKDGVFTFASEAKALISMSHISKTIDPQGVYLYLRHGLTDHDDSSLWRDVRKIPAAHYLEIGLDAPGSMHLGRYWQLNTGETLDISYQEAAERLRELFVRNIRLHLRSDVPVGTALSGGVDSSSIVAMTRQIQGSGLDLHAFCYLNDDPSLNEEKWADLAARNAAAKIHKTTFSPDHFIVDLDSLVYSLDEPFGGTSIYAQYCVFRLVHQHQIKVMLDGQGVDEMLGGYAEHISGSLISRFMQGPGGRLFSFLRSVWDRSDLRGWRILLRAGGLILPEPIQALGQGLIGEGLFPAWMNAHWFREREVEGCPLISLTHRDHRLALRSLLYQSFTKTSLPMLLRYEDHNSMAHSIESRVPFLTPAFAQFVFSLPEEYIIDGEGVTKSILRQAMRGIVPDEILNRRDKIGFQTPERKLLTALQPWIMKMLVSDSLRAIPVLNMKQVIREFNGLLNGKSGFDRRFWRWINLLRWIDIFEVTF